MALRDLLVHGEDNLEQGAQHISLDTRRSVIIGQKKQLIATIGLEDMAVISAGNVILVCPLDRVQEIKHLVEHIKQSGFGKYL